MVGTLNGQVAFVTGAGRGVGRAIAEALAQNGSFVGLCSRTRSQLEEVADSIGSKGGRALALTTDVTDPTAVAETVATIEDELGPISLLVNNAGTLNAVGPFVTTDPAVWWRDIETHVLGTILCTHAVLQRMIERNSGRIVNVVGMLGQFGEPNVSAYATAKAALFRLTENLGNELVDSGIKVFSVSPGPVHTQMTDQFLNDPEVRRLVPDFSEMPQEDWLSAEEGANLVVRLARGDADILSGRYIHVYEVLDDLIADTDEIKGEDRLVMRIRRRSDS